MDLAVHACEASASAGMGTGGSLVLSIKMERPCIKGIKWRVAEKA